MLLLSSAVSDSSKCRWCGGISPRVMNAHSLAALNSAAPTLRQKPRTPTVSVFAASTLSKTERQAKRQPREENVGLESKKAFYVDHTCTGEY